MFLKRSCFPLIAAAGLMLTAACGQAEPPGEPAVDVPPSVKALEAQGLTILQEFEVGGGLRAFAAAAGDQPVAVYVTSDGNTIVGTRLDANGLPLDEAVLQELVAKPISDKIWARLESADWIRDGSAEAPRIVYTFSDPNCPYCNRLWHASRPWVESGKVQLRHLMVGVIREDSAGKVATILAADDPAAKLAENERRFAEGGVPAASSVAGDVLRSLDANQRLMTELGFHGTPGLVFRDDDGIVQRRGGMPQGADLDVVMGPR